MPSKFFEDCIDMLHEEDVQQEIRKLMTPIINAFLREIYPYIYLSVLIVCISFGLILGIFWILIKKKNTFKD